MLKVDAKSIGSKKARDEEVYELLVTYKVMV
jgi:hypothetical protein